jgi:hypothetical protein
MGILTPHSGRLHVAAWAWKGRVVANLSCVSVAHPWRRVASQPPDEDALLVKNN